jgi:hypothetical protein
VFMYRKVRMGNIYETMYEIIPLTHARIWSVHSYIHDFNGREITTRTVMYGEDARFRPTLLMS